MPGMMDTVLDIVSCRFVVVPFTRLYVFLRSTRSVHADTNNNCVIDSLLTNRV